MTSNEQGLLLFAVTTRGLEEVSAAEIAALPGAVVERVGYRLVFAYCQEPSRAWFGLRTVDDLFLYLETWPKLSPQRNALPDLQTRSARLNLEGAMDVIGRVRKLSHPLTFSVTANFVGKRNYASPEIKKAVADGIQSRHWCRYVDEDQEADLNLRVFIEHETALVGVRLGRRPLYRRAYKQIHIPGSLKPSVAAALLSLVETAPGMSVLDPCCGAGTILVEAAADRALVLGGDLDPQALVAAQVNATAAGLSLLLCQWDAQALPLADHAVDRIVSNLPWGREAPFSEPLGQLYRGVCSEFQRVLAPGGKVALLTSLPGQVHLPRLRLKRQFEISLFGQNPTVMIWSN